MNKKLIMLAASLTVIGVASQAREHVPYVGADYAYVGAHGSIADPFYHAASVHLGDRYNDYFGTELFYRQTGSDSHKTASGFYKTSYRAYGLDMTAYLPLGCTHRFEPFASLGLGEYVFKTKVSPQKHHNDSGYGYRFGAGLLYNLTEHVGLRLGASYVKTDHISDTDHLIEYQTGLRYSF